MPRQTVYPDRLPRLDGPACLRSGCGCKFSPGSLSLLRPIRSSVWFSVFNLFVVSVFRGFMADIWRLDQAKRLFGFIGVAVRSARLPDR